MIFDILQSARGVIDAPPHLVLACPVGIIAALHFASATPDQIKGAKSDSYVKQARAELVQRPRWVALTGVTFGLALAATSFLYLKDPSLLPSIVARLPL